MALNFCNNQTNLFPCGSQDLAYNASIQEAMRQYLCSNPGRVYFTVVAGNVPGLPGAAPATILDPPCDGDYNFEIYDNGFIVWTFNALWSVVASRAFGSGGTTVIRHVELVPAATSIFTLPSATTADKIIYVEFGQVKFDEQSEAIAGNTFWTIAGDQLTLSDPLEFGVLRVAYLS